MLMSQTQSKQKACLALCLIGGILATQSIPAGANTKDFLSLTRCIPSHMQTYQLQNLTLKIERPVYEQLSLQEQPFPLKGSLKNQYMASQYTLRNNSDTIRTVSIQRSQSATKALADIQLDRFRLGKTLLIFPASVAAAGKVLSFPMHSWVHSLNKSNNDRADDVVMTVITLPFAGAIAAAYLVFSAAATAVLVPVNVIGAPVLYPLDHYNDQASRAQIQQNIFKNTDDQISIQAGETVQFVLLTQPKANLSTRPVLEVH